MQWKEKMKGQHRERGMFSSLVSNEVCETNIPPPASESETALKRIELCSFPCYVYHQRFMSCVNLQVLSSSVSNLNCFSSPHTYGSVRRRLQSISSKQKAGGRGRNRNKIRGRPSRKEDSDNPCVGGENT